MRDSDAAPHLLRTWVAFVSLGEFLGFALPAITAALIVDASTALSAAALLAAGAVEGAVLGWFQAGVLGQFIPALNTRRWIRLTAMGATIAWAIGLVPSQAYERIQDWPGVVLWPAIAVGASGLLLSIGVAQWYELRRHVDRAHRWILATSVGWLAGLACFTAVTTSLWHPGQSPLLVGAIGVLGGAVMAVTMALVTGVLLIGMFLRSEGLSSH